MRLSTSSVAAIAGLSVAIAGIVSIPLLSSPSSADPLQRSGRFSGQPSATLSQMPMHRGQSGQYTGPGQQGPGHHGPMMQVNSEFEFLSLMIPHHQEAIATAQRVLEYSDRPEMRAFAQDIIAVQTAEVEQMQAWLKEWYPNQTTTLTYQPMMGDLSQLEGDELDRAFLEDMIMHHMGAVMMAQHLVNFGQVEHQAVGPFAQTIADTQRQEIWQMQGWLQDWYGVAGMPMGPGRISGGRPCPMQ